MIMRTILAYHMGKKKPKHTQGGLGHGERREERDNRRYVWCCMLAETLA